MKVVSLLTGRGNNTLKDKNIIDVLGHPVLYYPAKAVADSKYIGLKYCSSDDENILREASKLGYTSIIRPKEFAQPNSSHADCIFHALDEIKNKSAEPDILVVTLANNVTVKTEWVNDCIEIMMRDMNLSAVVPVYKDNDHHPLRAKKIGKNGLLDMFEEGYNNTNISTNRQDLEPCYFLAHNFWVLNVKSLRSCKNGQPPWTFMGNKVKPYEIPESIDIHDKLDIELAKGWLKTNGLSDTINI